MLNFNEKDIKDIVSKLESGMIYYIHKTSGERIFVTKPFAIGKRFCWILERILQEIRGNSGGLLGNWTNAFAWNVWNYVYLCMTWSMIGVYKLRF